MKLWIKVQSLFLISAGNFYGYFPRFERNFFSHAEYIKGGKQKGVMLCKGEE